MGQGKSELYFSIDVETNGPIPGPYSMLSIGAAAFLENGNMLEETFSANLEPLATNKESLPEVLSFYEDDDGVKEGHPDTIKWLHGKKRKQAYLALQEGQKSPANAMREFADWVRRLADEHNARPVFVSFSSFDFMFLHWYLFYFLGDEGKALFSHSGLDIKTFAMATLSNSELKVFPFKETVPTNMPDRWTKHLRQNHIALDDAVDQGKLFMEILGDNLCRDREGTQIDE